MAVIWRKKLNFKNVFLFFLIFYYWIFFWIWRYSHRISQEILPWKTLKIKDLRKNGRGKKAEEKNDREKKPMEKKADNFQYRQA